MQFSDWSQLSNTSYLLFFLSRNTLSHILRLSPVDLLWITLECRIYLCQKRSSSTSELELCCPLWYPIRLCYQSQKGQLNTVKIHFLSYTGRVSVFTSHPWLVVPVLDSIDINHFHHCRMLFCVALVYGQRNNNPRSQKSPRAKCYW